MSVFILNIGLLLKNTQSPPFGSLLHFICKILLFLYLPLLQASPNQSFYSDVTLNETDVYENIFFTLPKELENHTNWTKKQSSTDIKEIAYKLDHSVGIIDSIHDKFVPLLPANALYDEAGKFRYLNTPLQTAVEEFPALGTTNTKQKKDYETKSQFERA